VEHTFINDVAVCIIVAWILAVIAQLLKQPLILAYLAAGFLIGPVGIGLVKEKESIETISGLGLILLLFMIGLEIDLKKMMSAGRIIFATALAQIFGCCLLGVLYFALLGFSIRAPMLDGIYLAVAMALSSTVIIVKILYEKRELDTYAGRITLGILVLQDLFAILFLAIQPELNNPSALLMAKSLGKVALLVAVAFTASRYALPPVFRAVARLPELVLVGALAWCFSVAGLAGKLGLSREMGALIAGVGISTFPYTLDVVAKVTSIRDFFVTLFFVALGMAVPQPTLYLLGMGAAIALFVLVSRFVTVFTSLQWMRQGLRSGFLASLQLSQISELSLVILALGFAAGHISEKGIGIAAYAFIFTAVGSSYAIQRSEGIAQFAIPVLRRLGLKDINDAPGAAGGGGHHSGAKIVLLGFSWTASSLLEEMVRKQPDMLEDLLVIDFNPVVHRELKKRKVRAIYGDISQRDTLLHAGVQDAQIIVCTLPNMVMKGITNLKLVRQLREINPTASLVVHSELFGDVPDLYAAGATYVSLPRLTEAASVLDVIEAARQNLLDEKRLQQQREMENRREVIP
jgi:Kef-type K+ transport system membrane component KefB